MQARMIKFRVSRRTMAYPAPPWHLHGRALFALYFVDLPLARPFVPPELDLVTVLPGKTLGGVYAARYQPGSTLDYSELLVVPALARYGDSFGAWISHIYVDSSESLAGGREIWGLPKELAVFDWEQEFVSISQDGEQLAMLHYHPWLHLPSPIRPQLAGTVFGCRAGQLLHFTGEFQGRLSAARCRLSLPEGSSLTSLHFGQSWLAAYTDDMRFVAQPPRALSATRLVAPFNAAPASDRQQPAQTSAVKLS